MYFKLKHEKSTGTRLSREDTVTLYNKKIKVSSGEAVSDAFMCAAVPVFDRILSVAALRSIVLAV